MNGKLKGKKEINILLLAFITLGVLGIGYKYFEYYNVKKIASISNSIFEHPLKVSNASRAIQTDIYKIHKDMKDMVLSQSSQEIVRLAKEVDMHEQRVYKNLNIIEKNILGKEGAILQRKTKQLFSAWRPIRNEVISLVNNNQTKKAIAITQGKGAQHVLKLEASAIKLYNYAHKKAIGFITESKAKFEKSKKTTLIAGVVFLFLFISTGSYVIYRISHFIKKNEHLKNVLSVIRDVNQLIVRQKDPQKMIQQSCNILTSTGVYGQAWIVTYDANEEIEYFATTDIENIQLFKDKLNSGWVPCCIEKTENKKKPFSFVEDTSSECLSCSISNKYNNKSAFNIQLKHGNKLYGYLTLSVDKKYFQDNDELSLLNEVAGDIAYALYNIEVEKEAIAHQKRYKELFNNMQSAVAIYTPKNDGEKFIFSDFNHTAEKIESIDKSSVLDKDVQEVFPGIEEYGLLDVFKRVYKTGIPEEFAIKEYKDKRVSGWRENYVYKLSSNEIVAIYLDKSVEKSLELELKEREELYRYVIEGTTDGIWDWNIITNSMFFSPRCKEMLGYRDDEIKNDFTEWKKRIHPDDKKKVFSDIKKSHEGKTKFYKNIHRLKHKDGHWIWIEARGQTLFDNDGRAIRMIGSNTDITKEKEFEEKLIYLKELYDNIINSVENILFVKDQNYKYLACNKAFEKFTGLNKDKIIGKSDYDIFEKEVADFFRKHDEIIISKNNAVSNFEWVTYPDGSKAYLLTLKSPLRDSEGKLLGLVGNSADLTKQKKIQAQLLEIKARYEKAEQIGSVGSWEYNIETQQFWASKESKLIYGFNDDTDTFSTEVVESCIPDRKRVHQALVDLIEKGTTYNLEFEIHPYDGSDHKIITSVANLEKDADGNPVKVIGFIQDITKRKETQKKLEEQNKLMISQSRHAAMGEMIGMIAHQWRQPLSVISMASNNMIVDIELNNFKKTKAKEYAQDIIEQTYHLSKTIDDFRNFFKPDKAISLVNLKDILDDTYKVVKDSLYNNNIEFRKSYASKSEVEAYPRELMQVFVNIINNAKDILVSEHNDNPYIEVKVYEDDDYVIADIIDNGTGIDEDILPKVFEPYFTTKDEKTGTGLGLYMSKLIIERHLHGKIEAFNTENGACFRVRLLKNSSLS